MLFSCLHLRLHHEGKELAQAQVLKLSGPVIAADHRIQYRTEAGEDPGESHHIVYIGDDSGSQSECCPDYLWYADGLDRFGDYEQVHILKVSEKGSFWTALVMKCVCHKTGEYKRIGILYPARQNTTHILKLFEDVEDRVVNLV